MGLDMYLYKESYVPHFGVTSDEPSGAYGRHQIAIESPLIEDTGIEPHRIAYILEEVMYWRKSNHIHKWFVENVQGGADNCKRVLVSREVLKELIQICEIVIDASELVDGEVITGYQFAPSGNTPIVVSGTIVKDPTTAKELLATTDGFFFGGTDYDENYIRDCKDTAKALREILAEPGDGDFYYEASW
jgi:hypothetical protein